MGLGRLTAGVGRKHKAEREAREAKEREATSMLQNVAWAITGKPATSWQRAEPGLQETVADLNTAVGRLNSDVAGTTRAVDQLVTRVERLEKLQVPGA